MARYPKDMLEQMLSAMRPGGQEGGEPPRPRPAKPKPKPSRSPGSGGPFALGGDRPRRPASAGGASDPSAVLREVLVNLGPAKLGVILALLLLAAFFLGRASRPIRAAEGAPAGSPVAAADSAAAARDVPPAAPAAERPDPDAALKDPRNRFTVMAVTYQDTEEQREMARATFSHLRRSGFPVFRPYLRKGRVLLMVGAAPRQSDLEDLQTRLRALRSPRGALEFEDAYLVAIEDYVQR